MINWEDVLSSDSADELKAAKLFLFQENMRLENERKALEEERQRIKQLQDDFIKDRVMLRDELNELNQATLQERKRLREELQFFEKKLEILQNGFFELDKDRKKLIREREAFEELRQNTKILPGKYTGDYGPIAQILFQNVSGPLAIRKRYKDLVKIFHPDNLFGDSELISAINYEFQRRKDED